MKMAAMLAFPMVISLAACSNWYQGGHTTISGLYTTTDVAWTYARRTLHANAMEQIDQCNAEGIPKETCNGWQDIAIARRNLATAIGALDSAMIEAYEALQRAKGRPEFADHAMDLVQRAVRVALDVRTLMQKRRLWRDEMLRPLPEAPQ